MVEASIEELQIDFVTLEGIAQRSIFISDGSVIGLKIEHVASTVEFDYSKKYKLGKVIELFCYGHELPISKGDKLTVTCIMKNKVKIAGHNYFYPERIDLLDSSGGTTKATYYNRKIR